PMLTERCRRLAGRGFTSCRHPGIHQGAQTVRTAAVLAAAMPAALCPSDPLCACRHGQTLAGQLVTVAGSALRQLPAKPGPERSTAGRNHPAAALTGPTSLAGLSQP